MKNLLEYNVRDVAANIRTTRERLFYSQEYLAAKLCISQNTYSKIELGYVKLTLERFFKICQILDVSPSDIINSERSVAA